MNIVIPESFFTIAGDTPEKSAEELVGFGSEMVIDTVVIGTMAYNETYPSPRIAFAAVIPSGCTILL